MPDQNTGKFAPKLRVTLAKCLILPPFGERRAPRGITARKSNFISIARTLNSTIPQRTAMVDMSFCA
jgi:hypothetical protein